MNPHEMPAERDSASKGLSYTLRFVFAGLCMLAALWIAAPGLIYMLSDMASDTTNSDADVSLFGILIAPGTAQWLTFGVAPILLGVSAYVAHRGVGVRRQHIGTPCDESV